MSKIFEALRNLEGDLSQTILPALAQDEQPAAQTGIPAAVDAPAIQAILGTVEAGLPPSFIPALTENTLPDLVRELPIQVSSSAPLLPFDDTAHVAAEQYRMIRTRLLQHAGQPRILLVSSTGPADGKTVTAVNIAGALSLMSKACVLLADTDFRRPTIHTKLGLPLSPGLTEVLGGTATLSQALIRIKQFPNLYCITAGEPVSNPSELLDSPGWSALCSQLRSLFRYVVADSPPVASVADYELLQATCDGVVLVARPDHTKRIPCRKAIQMVPKAKLIGVVMNCVTGWPLGHFSPGYYSYLGAAAGERLGLRR